MSLKKMTKVDNWLENISIMSTYAKKLWYFYKKNLTDKRSMETTKKDHDLKNKLISKLFHT